MAELLDHRVNVGEGTIRGLFFSLLHLDVTHLDLNLLTSLLSQLLHVAFNKLNLRIKICVACICILELFFKFQVSDLKLMNLPLVLLFTLFKAQIRLS